MTAPEVDDFAVPSAGGTFRLAGHRGRTVRGSERSAFVVDRDARLAKAWRGVKRPGHVDEVLALVTALR